MVPTKEELKTLGAQTGLNISIYMPTHMAGADTRENPIRFKNRLQEAERRLNEHNIDESRIDALLGSARQLVNDNDFWQHQREGFAMFLSEEEQRQYKLPFAPREITVVAEHFHVKPMLPYIAEGEHFFILAASLNDVRLFEATRFEVSEVALEDTPTSLAEALKYDDPEASLDHYTISAGGRGGGGENAVFQGQGSGKDERNVNILRFFKELDNGVRRILEPQGSRIPVVFVGDKGIFPIYQEANHYNGLVDENVDGNPDDLDAKTLHEKAWPIAEPRLQGRREEDKDNYMHKAGADPEHASNTLEDILPAAFDSRIETLFVAQDAHRWGRYDLEARQVKLNDDEQPGDSDLLDLAALHTILNGGTVYAVEKESVPGEEVVAAIYRF